MQYELVRVLSMWNVVLLMWNEAECGLWDGMWNVVRCGMSRAWAAAWNVSGTLCDVE